MEKFVSRGGEKLQHALNEFGVDVKDKVVVDFGCSTGGFTDCLLQRGAKKVYAVDTAYGELDWKLRNDPRVVVMERTNAIHVKLPERVDLVTVDTGWTKQGKIIPNALVSLKEGGLIISLIKPHYEAGKNRLTDEELGMVLAKVKKEIEEAGGEVVETVESPITGGRAGNREYLALIKEG